jgi:predicted RNA-binding protein with PIN domain
MSRHNRKRAIVHFLVDGHNLIGQMPDIALDDPDDEGKLVDQLHRFVLRYPRHQVTVVFDGGTYGHPHSRDPQRVRTIFAHSPGDADSRLIRILEACSNPAGHTLVTADRAVRTAANTHAIKTMPPAEFIILLNSPAPRRHTHHRPTRPEPKQPRSAVDEWLQIFGVSEE